LKTTRVRSESRIRNTWSRYVWALASISARVRGLRVSDFPVGSPIIPVKSPMTKNTVCPSSWNWRIFSITTV
jgi:hypothetical protein